ncbi:MAG TPA: hypothetical protein VGH23_08370 [Rhizomicrobium sp.]|jgi:hypothetical protein
MRKHRPHYFFLGGALALRLRACGAQTPPRFFVVALRLALALAVSRDRHSSLLAMPCAAMAQRKSAVSLDFPLPHFFEKWSYLPICQAKIAGTGKILPTTARDREILAGHYFPLSQKIDV